MRNRLKEAGINNTFELANIIYIILIFCFCPYFMLNGYFNTIYAKACAFEWSVAALICMTAAAAIFEATANSRSASIKEDTVENKKEDTEGINYRSGHSFGQNYKWNATDAAVFSFFISAVISMAVSDFPDAAWTGNAGWYVGTKAILLAAISYLLLRFNPVRAPIVTGIIGISFIPECIFIILYRYGIDLFSLHSKLISSEINDYAGTIGNIDTVAGYLSVMLPVMAACTYKYRRRKITLLYITDLILGAAALICAYTDGAVLGVLFGIIMLIIYLLARPGGRAALLRKAVILCLIVLIITCIAASIMIYIKEGYDFGNRRGRIWHYAVSIFASQDLLHRIFGVGPDCFGIYTNALYHDEIEKIWGEGIANAHNEPLQYLVTTGICGALSYISIFLCTIHKNFKKNVNNKLISPLFFGMMGYMAQAMVNNPHCLLMPVFFMLAAMC